MTPAPLIAAALEAPSMTVVWLALIAAASGAVTSFFGWLNSRTTKKSAVEATKQATVAATAATETAKQATVAAEQAAVTAVHAEETKVHVTAVHKAVNSEREILAKKLEKLEALVVDMAREKALMIEERAQLIAQARSTEEAMPAVIRVLALDDDVMFLTTLKGILERDPDSKFEVDTVLDPAEAKALFLQKKHHAYLVDYRLGKDAAGGIVSGMTFINMLRGAAHIGPFIVLSAFVDDALEKEIRAQGVQLVRDKETLIRGTLAQDIRYAVQAFLAAQRAKQ